MKLLIILAAFLFTTVNPLHAQGQQLFECGPGMYQAIPQAQESFPPTYDWHQAAVEGTALCPQCQLTRGQQQGFPIFGQYAGQGLTEQREIVQELVIDNPQAVVAGSSPVVSIYKVTHGQRLLMARWRLARER